MSRSADRDLPARPAGEAERARRQDLASILLDLQGGDEQRRTRIAWLYYVEGRTQGEIAERLGINRVKVNRDLAACRDSGLVQIRINGRLASCVALEQRLRARFGLDDAVVVPTPSDPADIPVALGMAVGTYVSDRAVPGMTVGVGWGRTLRWSVRAMRRRRVEGLTVVSLMGGLGRASEINTYETASRMAEAFEAACFYLAAPTYAASAALRDMLLDQAALRAVCERGRAADLTLLSVGSLAPETTMMVLGLLTADERRLLLEAGAVGDLLGHFLDAAGQSVDHPLNARVIGLSPAELSSVPIRVLASGGPDKAAIIAGALRAGHATVLVTDEETAGALA